MTIGASNRNDAVGSGSTATYPYGYKIFAATDLLVTVRDPSSDVEYTLTYPTHYSVTGVGVKTGGNIVLAGSGNAWQDGSGYLKNTWPISIRRVRPFTQETDIRNQGDYRASVHEDTFDNLMMVDQQQQDELDRSLKLPETVAGSSVDTLLPVPEASVFLGWNAAANAIVNYAGLASAAVSSAWAAVVGSASLATGRAAMGFSAYFDTLIGAANAAAFRALIGVDISLYALKGANADITALTALTSGTPFRKNALINGDFQVWQEGTNFAAMANGQYVADNWKYSKSGAMVHTGSRSTDVPTIVQAGRKILYSMLIDCTTVDAAIAAGDYAAITAYVEGYNFVNIAGVGLCHQFWHKHTKTGTYCVGYSNSINDRSFVREYTQAVADTWELATVLIDASPTAGTWDYTNEIGLGVTFTLAAGVTFQSAAGAWTAGNFFATANQVNACDNVANNFMLAGVQLEKGSVATEFDVRMFQDELAACQRYFQKTFPTNTTPSNTTNLGDGGEFRINPNGGEPLVVWQFKVEMRAAPTGVLYGFTGRAAGQWTTGAADSAAARFLWSSTRSVILDNSGTALAAGNWHIHATASARF